MINLLEESVKAAVKDSLEEKKDNGDDANSDLKLLWNEYLKKEPYSQCDSFLNVNWETLKDQRDEIVQIYVEYMDRVQRLNGQLPGFGPFNLILENLSKNSVQSVTEAITEYADRSSMAKRFTALGFKLNNNKITVLEALLFIYGKEKDQFVASPPTAASDHLRKMQKEQRELLKAHQDREDAITNLKKALEDGTVKKMKIANERLKLKKMEEDLKRDGVQMKRDTKKAQKNVDAAQQALEEETKQGTDASNWFKAEVEKNSKQSASAKWG